MHLCKARPQVQHASLNLRCRHTRLPRLHDILLLPLLLLLLLLLLQQGHTLSLVHLCTSAGGPRSPLSSLCCRLLELGCALVRFVGSIAAGSWLLRMRTAPCDICTAYAP